MLLENKTLDKFGYYSKILKPNSEKLVVVQCDYCNSILDKQFTKYNSGRTIVSKDCCTNRDCIAKKTKESWSVKYPEGHPNRTPEIQEKRKSTVLQKYGVENVAQLESNKQKSKKTILEKYGVDHHLQNKDILQKQIDTNLKKYGVERPLQNKQIKQKQQQTCLDLYGEQHVNKLETVKKENEDINFKKYGCKFTGQIHIPKESLLKLDDAVYLHDQHHVFLKDLYTIAKELDVSFYTIHNYYKKHNIDIKKYESVSQIELYEFIKSLDSNINIIKNNRTILKPKELDIYLPDKNLAIEYCGLYWHNEKSPEPRDRYYHYNKFKDCLAKGIRLITIFEDEWTYNKEGVKNLLKSIIVPATRKVQARLCDVKVIDKPEIKTFLENTHIQKNSNGYIFGMGIYEKTELLGVMTFSKHHRNNMNNSIILSRMSFKDGVCVIGGASKLLHHAKEHIKKLGYSKIVSWSDNRYSEGKVYEKMGFVLEENLKPDYSYVNLDNNRCVRLSKQSCTKGGLGAGTTQTESERAEELGLAKIWDCGKKRWVLTT